MKLLLSERNNGGVNHAENHGSEEITYQCDYAGDKVFELVRSNGNGVYISNNYVIVPCHCLEKDDVVMYYLRDADFAIIRVQQEVTSLQPLPLLITSDMTKPWNILPCNGFKVKNLSRLENSFVGSEKLKLLKIEFDRLLNPGDSGMTIIAQYPDKIIDNSKQQELSAGGEVDLQAPLFMVIARSKKDFSIGLGIAFNILREWTTKGVILGDIVQECLKSDEWELISMPGIYPDLRIAASEKNVPFAQYPKSTLDRKSVDAFFITQLQLEKIKIDKKEAERRRQKEAEINAQKRLEEEEKENGKRLAKVMLTPVKKRILELENEIQEAKRQKQQQQKETEDLGKRETWDDTLLLRLWDAFVVADLLPSESEDPCWVVELERDHFLSKENNDAFYEEVVGRIESWDKDKVWQNYKYESNDKVTVFPYSTIPITIDTEFYENLAIGGKIAVCHHPFLCQVNELCKGKIHDPLQSEKGSSFPFSPQLKKAKSEKKINGVKGVEGRDETGECDNEEFPKGGRAIYHCCIKPSHLVSLNKGFNDFCTVMSKMKKGKSISVSWEEGNQN